MPPPRQRAYDAKDLLDSDTCAVDDVSYRTSRTLVLGSTA